MWYCFKIIDQSKCYCEFKYGFGEKSGILCKRNGTFEKVLLCGSKSFCTGPSSKQDATKGTSVMCTQEPGKIINNMQLFHFIVTNAILNFIWNYQFSILIGVYCGNDEELYLSCEHCPRTNDTVSNRWCGGNCKFDSVHQICKEGNWLISSYCILEPFYSLQFDHTLLIFLLFF